MKIELDLEVRNFGKIKNAKVKIRPFTVIAGKNSSGKSFITKALYSLFRTLNKDVVSAEMTISSIRILNILKASVNSIRLSQVEEVISGFIMESAESLKDHLFEVYSEGTYTSQIAQAGSIQTSINDLKSILDSFVQSVSSKKKYQKIQQDIEFVKTEIQKLEHNLANPSSLYAKIIQNEFRDSLKENFQTPNLDLLKNFETESQDGAEFEFDQIGSIKIIGDAVNFKLRPSGIDTIQNLSNIVYLESPIYWRLRSALVKLDELKKFRFLSNFKKQDALTGVPQHFYDLLQLLSERIKKQEEKCSFEKISQTLNEQIEGKLLVSNSGEINYRSSHSEKEISLYSTATGIINLGIVSLLLERNVITPGSFIIIDEPEVNLHPAWQRVFIESMYELSKNGINIIIATHSIDMIKCIECITEQLSEKEAYEHFGINQLDTDGRSVDLPDMPSLRLSSILTDLGESFVNMQLGI